MEDIFENAKFGDRFVTKNGTIFIYIEPILRHKHHLMYKPEGTVPCDRTFDSDGKFLCDKSDTEMYIIGRYKEDIDEDDLDKLAWKLWNNNIISDTESFKMGYHKAKE